MSPSDNASGAFSGQAHISRRGLPGLRLTVWRAVWPMLQYNPVMAARYQAMTRAADAGGGNRRRTAAGHGGAGGGPRPARQGPRRVRRFAVALDLLPDGSTTSRNPAVAAGAASLHDTARTQAEAACPRSAYPPHPNGLPRPFLPDEGESEPVPPSGTNPADNPGQLSPGRPEPSHQLG